jgi:hypothetical protein
MQIARITHSRLSGTTVYITSDVSNSCYVVNLYCDRAGSTVTKFSMKKGADRSDRPVDRFVADHMMMKALQALSEGA